MTKVLGKVDNMTIYRRSTKGMIDRYAVKIGAIVVSDFRPYADYGTHYREAIARVAHNKG